MIIILGLFTVISDSIRETRNIVSTHSNKHEHRGESESKDRAQSSSRRRTRHRKSGVSKGRNSQAKRHRSRRSSRSNTNSEHLQELVLNRLSRLMQPQVFFWKIAVLALMASFNAIRFGIADVLADEMPVSTLSQTADSVALGDKELTKKIQSFDIASAIHSQHPKYESYATTLELVSLLRNNVKESALKPALIELKSQFLSQIQHRPLYPIPHARVLEIKWLLNEFDVEFLTLFKRVDRLGSQDAYIHVLITKIGIMLVQNEHPMTEELLPLIQLRMSKGLRNKYSRETILSSVNYLGALDEACQWMQEKDLFVVDNYLNCESK